MPADKPPAKPKTLSDSVQFLKGVGPRRAELFNRLGCFTAGDCLMYLPFRYEDRTQVKTISELRAGESATIQASVMDAGVLRMGRRRKLFEVVLQDETGTLRLKWYRFRESYMSERYVVGTVVIASGKATPNRYLGSGVEMVHPDVEFPDSDTAPGPDMGRIVPVYPATEGLNQKTLRRIMENLMEVYFPLIEEFLPKDLLTRHKFPTRQEALRNTHFPPEGQDLRQLQSFRSRAQVRLIFEELFLLQLGLAFKRKHRQQTLFSRELKTRGPLIRKLIGLLPFQLTGAQKKVLGEIMTDLESERPMHRLLHGDVGAGKTLVALITLLTAVDNGQQGALMAPTELLAEQHFNNLLPYCRKLDLRIELITSSASAKEKKQKMAEVAAGAVHLVVGTHALIQKEIEFASLGLVVIDEQHRFGVLQREALGKKGTAPHVLVMTATPIPRSLAMTLYGDMDVSRLDEMPPGRQPITTRLFYENKRDQAYTEIDRSIREGRQAYVVCPLIEESENTDLKTVLEVYEELKQRFRHWKPALLHGRIKMEERQEIMAAFKEGEVNVLVATTVIEVGIDVPNATFILIEHAERFGLAQLHQLRGRVGRGHHASECLLVAYSPISPEGKFRLDAMVRTQDGFDIAEEDLKIRGPGDVMGTRQSGLPALRIANLIRDTEYIQVARKEAFALIDHDPHLALPDHRPLKEALAQYVGNKADLASIL